MQVIDDEGLSDDQQCLLNKWRWAFMDVPVVDVPRRSVFSMMCACERWTLELTEEYITGGGHAQLYAISAGVQAQLSIRMCSRGRELMIFQPLSLSSTL